MSSASSSGRSNAPRSVTPERTRSSPSLTARTNSPLLNSRRNRNSAQLETTNRFVAIEVEPQVIGTNRILGWKVNPDPAPAESAQKLKIELINLSPAGGFIVAFQVALYGGTVLAAPFILYFILSFVFPALRLKEQKYVGRGLLFGAGLFLAGVAFCYFLLMPVALAASQMYSNWLGFGALQWRAEDYISFVCKFMLGMGLGFELPVVLLTLVKIGVLSYRSLRAMWRYMIVIVLVLGGLLTTPEVLTQVMMAVPLYGLYELSVWIAWYWEEPDRKKRGNASCSCWWA
jgi:sec-independent protein translocase protein TatC